MQNLINQLLQPELGETKPSMVKRRAGELLAQLGNQAMNDQQARLACEADNRELLKLLTDAEARLEPSNHADVYQDVMNQDQDAAFN